MSNPEPLDPAFLAKHHDFVSRLALGLTQDVHGAADVAQEAWLRMLSAPPRHASSLRSWLATVVRNAAFNARRREARQHTHARNASASEVLPATDSIAERFEIERRVIDAVVALSEPAKSTLLLRYWDNLPPRVIAERLAIPVATVHSRLRLGLEAMRQELERRHGPGCRQWLAGLASASGLGTATNLGVAARVTSSLMGALMMTSKVKVLVAAAALLIASGGMVWQLTRTDRDREMAAIPRKDDDPVTHEPVVARAEVAATPGQPPAETRSTDTVNVPAPAETTSAVPVTDPLQAVITTGNMWNHTDWDRHPVLAQSLEQFLNGTLIIDTLLAQVRRIVDKAWVIPSHDPRHFRENRLSSGYNWWLAYRTETGELSRLLASVSVVDDDQAEQVLVRLPISALRWHEPPEPMEAKLPPYPGAYLDVMLAVPERRNEKYFPGLVLRGDINLFYSDLPADAPRDKPTNALEVLGARQVRGDFGTRVVVQFYPDRAESNFVRCMVEKGIVFQSSFDTQAYAQSGPQATRDARGIFDRVAALIAEQRVKKIGR